MQRAVVELKIVRGSLERTIEEGPEQTWDYMDRCSAVEGHLVVFGRDLGKAWEDKISRRVETHQGVAITVWGM